MGHCHSPVGHRAARIAVSDVVKCPFRCGVRERMQKRYCSFKRRLDRRCARGGEGHRAKMFRCWMRMLLIVRGVHGACERYYGDGSDDSLDHAATLIDTAARVPLKVGAFNGVSTAAVGSARRIRLLQ